jgi:hypothetical protein
VSERGCGGNSHVMAHASRSAAPLDLVEKTLDGIVSLNSPPRGCSSD